MHGRPREYKYALRDPDKASALAKKASLYVKVKEQAWAAMRDSDSSRGLLTTKSLLEVNPEVYSVWNYRRSVLVDVLERKDDEAKAAAQAELNLTQSLLKKHIKSYATWHHRKWVLCFGLSDLQAEMKLVESLFDIDDRNFHAWAFRRFVCALMNEPPQAQLDSVTQCINKNFSNYSAWHHRATLLTSYHAHKSTSAGPTDQAQDTPCACTEPRTCDSLQHPATASEVIRTVISCQNTPLGFKPPPYLPTESEAPLQLSIPVHVVQEELELVRQALYTDTSDSSGWLYHRWLLLQLTRQLRGSDHEQQTNGGGGDRTKVKELLEGEAAVCRDVAELDDETKWPILQLAVLLQVQVSVGFVSEGDGATSVLNTLWDQLIELDPMRKHYYGDMKKKQIKYGDQILEPILV